MLGLIVSIPKMQVRTLEFEAENHPRHLKSDLIGAVRPDTVFRILQALAASVGPVEGRRFRKRRRLYSPSRCVLLQEDSGV